MSEPYSSVWSLLSLLSRSLDPHTCNWGGGLTLAVATSHKHCWCYAKVWAQHEVIGSQLGQAASRLIASFRFSSLSAKKRVLQKAEMKVNGKHLHSQSPMHMHMHMQCQCQCTYAKTIELLLGCRLRGSGPALPASEHEGNNCGARDRWDLEERRGEEKVKSQEGEGRGPTAPRAPIKRYRWRPS
jgi:hypothetical protein